VALRGRKWPLEDRNLGLEHRAGQLDQSGASNRMSNAPGFTVKVAEVMGPMMSPSTWSFEGWSTSIRAEEPRQNSRSDVGRGLRIRIPKPCSTTVPSNEVHPTTLIRVSIEAM